ncbi:MAG TPA: ABC transporter ATP-binding protein, partial [Thermomicrobiales bacterium]|nr:ABC transporter ATP-binding protein [Thermomicrobiales bacterium]
MRSTRSLAGFLGPYKLWVVLAPLLMAVEVTMDLLQPRLIQRIIDEGIAQSDLGLVWRTGALMIVLAIIGMLGGTLCTLFAILAAQGFGADLRGTLF